MTNFPEKTKKDSLGVILEFTPQYNKNNEIQSSQLVVNFFWEIKV